MGGGEQTILLPGNTLTHLVRETISEMQREGLLLTKEQTAEYFVLKRESEDELILGVEAAKLLGVTKAMITHYRTTRLITGHRVGRRWKYSKLEILEFKKRTA